MSVPSVPVSSPAASDLKLRKTEAIRKLAAHLPDHDNADFIRLKKLAIVEKLLASFDEPNMSPFFLDEIESFHNHPPLRPAPAFLDDVNQRLQLLRDIKSTTMKREDDSSLPWQCLPAALITINVWAAFIAAPIEALQALLRRMKNAFEPVEKPDDHTVRVRLHLLQDTKLRCTWDGQRPSERQDTFQGRNDLATDPRKFLDPFVNDKFVTEGPLEIRVGSSVTQHIVRDGYIFDVTSEDPAILPSYDVLDMQYRIELMAALIGAGEDSEDAISSSTTEWGGDLSVASGYSHEDF
ncbi:hypothetical protein QIS74_09817 [Colletotrichum tabaci]|uniref:Uncharacterized protein n=1 Tax=Colletotrichum tabaci TaxID=1209068 RepID=A0AAV9T899_9PEZI